MASWWKYLEIACYAALLCFIVPMKIHDDNEVQFLEYVRRFNKNYENETVYNLRLAAFKQSQSDIERLNANQTNGSAKYDLTKFSDLSPEEFLNLHLLPRYRNENENSNEDVYDSAESVEKISKRSTKKLPLKVDWREKAAVTKVRSQNSCGACWAFSSIETIESMYAIKYGELKEFSVQQMIDCSTLNNGCEGGDICVLLEWLLLNGVPVTTEADYPLKLKSDVCKANQSTTGIQLEDYNCDSYVNNEDVILQLIAFNGPVTVAVNAKTWQNYASGIIQFHCDGRPLNLNHAVQLVGYDLTAPVPYYIARNTWGPDFGHDGYLYLAIGSNICGLANEVAAIRVA